MQSISSQNDKFHGSNAFHEFYDVCNNLGASACSHNPKGLDWWKCTFCSIFIQLIGIANSYRGVFRILIMSKLDHQMSRIWKKVASSFCKVLANLTGWKTEYLIAQLRAGIWRKVFRLKTCPQGVLQAQ